MTLLFSLATILLFPNNIQAFSETHFVTVYFADERKKKRVILDMQYITVTTLFIFT